MPKRDKLGRFAKKKVVKKKAKVAKKLAKKAAPKVVKKVTVQKPRKVPIPKLSDYTLYDLQDMIQAEVMFQMKEIW